MSRKNGLTVLLLSATLCGYAAEFLKGGSLDEKGLPGWTIDPAVKFEHREATRYSQDLVLELFRKDAGILLSRQIGKPARSVHSLEFSMSVIGPFPENGLRLELDWINATGRRITKTCRMNSPGQKIVFKRPPEAFGVAAFRLLSNGGGKVIVNDLALRSGRVRNGLTLGKRAPLPEIAGSLCRRQPFAFAPDPAEPLRILFFSPANDLSIDLAAEDFRHQFGYRVDVIKGDRTFDPETVNARLLRGEYDALLIPGNPEKYLRDSDHPVSVYVAEGGGVLFLSGPEAPPYGRAMEENLTGELPMQEINPPRFRQWGFSGIYTARCGKGRVVHLRAKSRFLYRAGIWCPVDEAWLALDMRGFRDAMNFNWQDFHSALYAKLLSLAAGKWLPAPPFGTAGCREFYHDAQGDLIAQPHPGTLCFQTLQQRNAAGRVTAFRTRAILTPGKIRSVTVRNRSFRKGDVLEAEVISPGGEIEITADDPAGQLLYRGKHRLNSGRNTLHIAIPAGRVRMPSLTLHFNGEKSVLCFLKNENPMRYYAAAYLWLPLHYRPAFREVFRRVGINMENCWPTGGDYAMADGFFWTDGWGGPVDNGPRILEAIQELGAHGRQSYTDPVRKHWRNGCISEPELEQALREESKLYARLIRDNPPLLRAIGDEMTLSAPWAGVHPADSEPCRMDACMTRFRNKMREKYGTIEKLNAVWKTRFRNFETLTPAFSSEVRGTGNYASYLEFRLFMDDVFASLSSMACEAFAAEKCPSGTGQPNWTWMTPAAGIDPSKIVPLRSGGQDYGPSAYIRSFRRPGTPVISWIFYAGVYDRGADSVRAQVWRSLREGATGFMMYNPFQADRGDREGFLTAAGCGGLREAMIKEVVEPLTSGLGDAVNAMERDNVRTILLHSQAGMNIAWLESGDTQPFNWSNRGKRNADSYNNWFRSQEQWEKTLNALGADFLYASETDLEQKLKKADLLILPMCYALSGETRKQIEAFQLRGGTVIADLNPGLYTGTGEASGTEFMRNIFGVEAVGKPDYRFSEVRLGNENAVLPRGGVVKIINAAAKGSSGKIPVLMETRRGKGRGVFCNFLPRAESNAMLTALRRYFPVPVRITRLCDGMDATGTAVGIYRVPNSEDRLIVITGTPFDSGALMTGTAPAPAKHPHSRLRLTLKHPAYLYDPLHSGHSFGKTETMEWDPSFGVLVLFLSNEKQTVPNVMIHPEKGGFLLRVSAASPRVFHCRIYNGEGKELIGFRQNSPLTANWEENIDLPLNVCMEKWKIVVTDSLTGKKTEKIINTGDFQP